MHLDVDFDQDAALVQQARRGDEAAFRLLLDGHRDALGSTLVACGVRCPETARDLAQDVCLRAWRRLGELNDPRAFRAWIRRIAANAARDHLRRTAVRRETSLEDALEVAEDDDPAARSERASELRLMLAALAEEDEESRQLLAARAEGVSVADLAAPRGISEAAMKMRLLRVRLPGAGSAGAVDPHGQSPNGQGVSPSDGLFRMADL